MGLLWKKLTLTFCFNFFTGIYMYIGSTKKLGAKNPINFFSLLQHILRSPLKWHFWKVAKMRHLGLTRKTFMGLVSHTCLHYPSCLSSLWDVCRVAPPKRMNFRKIAKIYIADFWPLNGAFLIWNWKQFATWLSENEGGEAKAVWKFFDNSSVLEGGTT